ncbi:Hypothetical predicted protein [Lecanosticta acicola]|uniref:Uncharacterized protein n=1 Tax=Lecanosticta acicola TaxID=111012 RepID=A0AAI9EFX6_9PEZI|nr:Hypothetical predicted protein [Lecanosticta acicola]
MNSILGVFSKKNDREKQKAEDNKKLDNIQFASTLEGKGSAVKREGGKTEMKNQHGQINSAEKANQDPCTKSK